MRPNFFVNTPDILNEYLQHGGPAAFTIRAVLAATMSPSWGVYSGYELFESERRCARAARSTSTPRSTSCARATSRPPTAEGRSLAPLLTQLNAIRRATRRCTTCATCSLHWIDNDAIISFSKRDPQTGDTILVLCNIDPRATQAGWTSLDLPALGLDWTDRAVVRDLLTGNEYDWGQFNFVRLDPGAARPTSSSSTRGRQ